jgi:hypothetical protein
MEISMSAIPVASKKVLGVSVYHQQLDEKSCYKAPQEGAVIIVLPLAIRLTCEECFHGAANGVIVVAFRNGVEYSRAEVRLTRFHNPRPRWFAEARLNRAILRAAKLVR